MYSQVLSGQYDKMKDIRKKNTAKKARTANQRKSKLGIPRGRPTRDTVFEKQMVEHFRTTCADGNIYSLPSGNSDSAEFTPLQAKLSFASRPAAKVDGDGLEDSCLLGDSGRCYFSIVRKSYSNIRTVPVPPAAGLKMGADDIGVAVHTKRGRIDADSNWISMQPSALANNPVMILSRLGKSVVEHAEDTFLKWSVRRRLSYNLDGLGTDRDFIDVVSKMVAACALPGAQHSFVLEGMDNQGACRQALDKLESSSLVTLLDEGQGSSQWQFTKLGVEKLTPIRVAHSPQPALQLRVGLPLADRTGYELMAMLEQQGWVWGLNAKNKKPAPYVMPDGEKLFYTSGLILPRMYAHCLLISLDLHAKGVTHIEHGCTPKYYKRLLTGCGSPSALPIADRSMDLDAGLLGDAATVMVDGEGPKNIAMPLFNTAGMGTLYP